MSDKADFVAWVRATLTPSQQFNIFDALGRNESISFDIWQAARRSQPTAITYDTEPLLGDLAEPVSHFDRIDEQPEPVGVHPLMWLGLGVIAFCLVSLAAACGDWLFEVWRMGQ